MGPKGPLIRHEVLSELQQLCMLLGVHPPQVLHMLNHHLHRFTHSGLLHMQGNWQASLLTLALEGHFSTLKGLSKHTNLMNGPKHLWTAGHSGHGLNEDFQVLLQTMDDLHGLVIFLTSWNQGLYNKTVLYSSYLFKQWNSGQILEEIFSKNFL